jgi:hypothetical protein
VNQATVNIALINIATIIEGTDATVMIDDPTIVIKMICAAIVLDATTRHEE